MMWHEIFFAAFITLSLGYVVFMGGFLLLEAYKHYKQLTPKTILFSIYLFALVFCGITAVILKKLGI
jgi:hypothetical protein